MRRLSVFTSVAVLCLGLLGGSALAQTGTSPDWADKTGGMGIGGQTTLGGSNGINIAVMLSKNGSKPGSLAINAPIAVSRPVSGRNSGS